MSTNLPSTEKTNNEANMLAAGIALIALGLVALIPQFSELVDLGMLIPLALGAIFLVWGLATRSFGLLIPGGILAGIGIGTLIIASPVSELAEMQAGGVFMLAFGAGWVLITLLSPLTEDGFQWWPLIPGGVIGAVGALLLAGDTGLQILKIAGMAWPLFLIAGGAYLIWKRR